MDQAKINGFWNGRTRRWTVAAALVAALAALVFYLALGGSPGSSSLGSATDEPPATLEPVGASGLQRVVLSARAAERIGIRTEPVRDARGRTLLVPYSAVVYDSDGGTWVYISPAALPFVRHRVIVDRIAGADAVLTRGPPAGTTVVTLGAAELFGTEFEFAED